MRSWLQGMVLAVVFAALGAFAASLWLEVRSEAAGAEAPSGSWDGRRIRVEVLNGAGVDGLARRATERLRGLGFDVVYYGNADRFGRDTSVAIARLGSVEPAWRVAEALGIRRVERAPEDELYLDVTVILGSDWVGVAEAAESRAAAAEGSVWWLRVKRALRRLWPGASS